jgi:hypothetical protein
MTEIQGRPYLPRTGRRIQRQKQPSSPEVIPPPAPPEELDEPVIIRPVPLGRIALLLIVMFWAYHYFGSCSMERPKKTALRQPIASAPDSQESVPTSSETPKPINIPLEFNGIKAKAGSFVGWSPNNTGNPGVNKSIAGNVLNIHGNVYRQGIGVQAPSNITFSLGGAVNRFSCLAGVDWEGDGPASVKFIVKGDGKKLFESPLMKAAMDPVTISLDVSGVKDLSLITDPVDTNAWDQADWVNIKFAED